MSFHWAILIYIKIENSVRKFICPNPCDVRKVFRPKVLNSLKIEKNKEA